MPSACAQKQQIANNVAFLGSVIKKPLIEFGALLLNEGGNISNFDDHGRDLVGLVGHALLLFAGALKLPRRS